MKFSERSRKHYLKNPEKLLAKYEEVLEQIFNPPEPWQTFGYYAYAPVGELDFWGVWEDGMPIWEKVKDMK